MAFRLPKCFHGASLQHRPGQDLGMANLGWLTRPGRLVRVGQRKESLLSTLRASTVAESERPVTVVSPVVEATQFSRVPPSQSEAGEPTVSEFPWDGVEQDDELSCVSDSTKRPIGDMLEGIMEKRKSLRTMALSTGGLPGCS